MSQGHAGQAAAAHLCRQVGRVVIWLCCLLSVKWLTLFMGIPELQVQDENGSFLEGLLWAAERFSSVNNTQDAMLCEYWL